MSITQRNIGNPSTIPLDPTKPDPNKPDPAQQKKELDKQKKDLKKQKKEIDTTLSEIDQRIHRTFQFVCALRLDMIADKLDHINPRLAQQIDAIADEIEKAELKEAEEDSIEEQRS